MIPQDTDKTVDTEEVKHLDTNKREKIFPILRKLDAIWQANPDKDFSAIINYLVTSNGVDFLPRNDDQLLKMINNTIEKDGIKFN